MPVNRREIEEQLAALGESDRWWESSEVRALPDILGDGEQILAIVRGRVRARFRRGSAWLVIVTTERLLCLRNAGNLGRRQLDMPASQVTGIEHTTRIFSAKITVIADARRIRLRVRRADAMRLVSALSTMAGRIRVPGRTAPDLLPAQEGELARIHDRIEMLEDEVARLRDQIEFVEKLVGRRIPDAAQREEPSPLTFPASGA